MEFYRRNYIEGLFLSSGVVRNPDYTMERLVRVAKDLREVHRFNGYIHLKSIPGASEELVRQAGLYADRLSVNLEIPTEENLKRLAPEKDHQSVYLPMKYIQQGVLESNEERKKYRKAPRFAPAGQSTQMIVGATSETDRDILRVSSSLYERPTMKRVYYSGYISVNTYDKRLPALKQPPLVRENRLYQADWLLRFYEFKVDELVDDRTPDLDLEIDPKLAWALRHPEFFPVNIQTADYESLLRVPGIGVRSAKLIVTSRQDDSGTGSYTSTQAPPSPSGQEKRRFTTEFRLRRLVYDPRKAMIIFRYDQSFEGLLTALFDAYSRKQFPDLLQAEELPLPLFYDEVHTVITDTEKAERVWKALQKKLSRFALSGLTRCWLSELPETPMLLFRDPDILAMAKLSKKVSDERTRVLQFMRFQKTAEGIYFGVMEPLYNVYPLTIGHFRDRFADQRWLIYDGKRKYGYYYDGKEVNEITFADPHQQHLLTGKLEDSLLDKDEKLFQQLWKSYFKSICIKERLNPVKHRKDMPVRYWKYLTEKG